jgi:putative endonuclease
MNHGLKLLTQNYHCKYGEIDLIMKDSKPLVFLEVRLKRTPNLATLVPALHHKKLILTAQHYLQEHGDFLYPFDAILMNKADANHIE